jgi:hypothetical protein
MRKAKKAAPAMTSQRVLDALAEKHRGDVFVPECKDGPSQNVNDYLRMDAWVMAKSWSNPCATVYEVKVSRADFLQDQKWHGYLPYCNAFYFACPHGLIQLGEVPAEAGLMYVTDGGRVLTKKKAPYRPLEVPESVYRYILMCRVRVCRGAFGDDAPEDRAAHWRHWLAQKKEKQEIGWNASRRLQELYREHVTEVRRKQKELEFHLRQYADIRQFLANAGLDPNSPYLLQVQNKMRDLAHAVPPELEGSLRKLKVYIDETERVLREIKEKASGGAEDAA